MRNEPRIMKFCCLGRSRDIRFVQGCTVVGGPQGGDEVTTPQGTTIWVWVSRNPNITWPEDAICGGCLCVNSS